MINIVMPIINDKFKNPIQINEIAKHKSFDKLNYKNVLKYIIDIN